MKIDIRPYLENVLSERFKADLEILGVDLSEVLPDVDDKIPEIFGNAFFCLLPESIEEVGEVKEITHRGRDRALGAAKKTFATLDERLKRAPSRK